MTESKSKLCLQLEGVLCVWISVCIFLKDLFIHFMHMSVLHIYLYTQKG